MTTELELQDKMVRLAQTVANGPRDVVDSLLVLAILDMGPGCLFDDVTTVEQRYGMWKTLDWLHTYVMYKRGKI